MNKILIFILIALCMGTLTSCNIEKAEGGIEKENVQVKNESAIGEKVEGIEKFENINYKINDAKYVEKKVIIRYPQISHLNNDIKEERLNEFIKNEALQVLNVYGGNMDKLSLEIEYKIKWCDMDFLSIVYSGVGYVEGAAHPNNLFYTSNINIGNEKKMRLTDCVIIDNNLVDAFRKYKAENAGANEAPAAALEYILENYSADDLIKCFNNADSSYEVSPFTFSYLTKNYLGISMEVPYVAGGHIEVEIPLQDIVANIKASIAYQVNESPDKEKQVFICKDYKNYKVILKNKGHAKVIYENYPAITIMDPYSYYFSHEQLISWSETMMDPYSFYSSHEYLISWSENSKYLFIKDSIYDVDKDQLISLEDYVVFQWRGNKGIYLAEGDSFTLGYDGAIHSEFAVGKKVKVFEEGLITELMQAPNNRYFILDPLWMLFTDNLYTAQLKYSVQELKQMIGSPAYYQLIQDNIIKPKADGELQEAYKALIDKIKHLKAYNQLEQKRAEVQENNSLIKTNSHINTFFDVISNHYILWNTRPAYYYKDKVKVEHSAFNESKETGCPLSDPILSTSDKGISGEMDNALEEAKIFEELTSEIRQLEAFQLLNDKITHYKSIAPVKFERIETFINLVKNE